MAGAILAPGGMLPRRRCFPQPAILCLGLLRGEVCLPNNYRSAAAMCGRCGQFWRAPTAARKECGLMCCHFVHLQQHTNLAAHIRAA